ncbi:MAG: PAS domain-containing sensor histidine kinase [bacterium]|nr:PAS domain-containing sensor histidine kinase [bacterium]
MRKDTRQYLADELLDVQRTLGWMDLVISSIDDAVCVIEANGNLIFANEYFSNLVGIPRVFLLGKPMKEVITLKKIDHPVDEYLASNNELSGPSEDNGIFEWKDAQGDSLIFKVSSRLLPNSEQHVFFLQNITLVYELNRMKDNFINLASHQLRTPLTAIMTYSHMLSDGMAGVLSKQQQELADTIVQSTERMSRLVNGLLKITRVQSKGTKFKEESVSFADVFEQIQTELKPRIIGKKLVYRVKIPADTPTIQNDRSAVHEVFSNLVVNAVQYTRESGKIDISIRATKRHVIVIVKDTGIGIPKEYHRHLFNQFSRADNAFNEFSDGTGLGLYLTKMLLDEIGGKIECSSALNVGTTFKVTLPIQGRIKVTSA